MTSRVGVLTRRNKLFDMDDVFLQRTGANSSSTGSPDGPLLIIKANVQPIKSELDTSGGLIVGNDKIYVYSEFPINMKFQPQGESNPRPATPNPRIYEDWLYYDWAGDGTAYAWYRCTDVRRWKQRGHVYTKATFEVFTPQPNWRPITEADVIALEAAVLDLNTDVINYQTVYQYP